MSNLNFHRGYGTYYNDNEPYVCRWLENLILFNILPNGVVDCRPIQEVTANDVQGFTQCHFFAGIGGWAYALHLAGWPNDSSYPIWTGSCPCQPFSVAGKREGEKDSRHLWPEFARLIRKRRPSIVVGEQVASADGRVWLSRVRSDLERMGYAVGGADLCAAGVGAPHIRQRLWWVADTDKGQCGLFTKGQGSGHNRQTSGRDESDSEFESSGITSGVADCTDSRLEERQGQSTRQKRETVERSSAAHGVPDTTTDRRQQMDSNTYRSENGSDPQVRSAGSTVRGDVDSVGVPKRDTRNSRRIADEPDESVRETDERASTKSRRSSDTHWSDSQFHPCLDGKYRRIPTQPALFPLAHRIPGRISKLRAIGNAINPQVAAEFIHAYMNVRGIH